MENCEQLAAGIVERAVKDYLNVRIRKYKIESGISKCINRERELIRINNEIYEVTSFFKSKWFKTLSPTIDEATIMFQLEKRFEENKDKKQSELKELGLGD